METGFAVVRPSQVDNLFVYSAIIEGGCVGSETNLLGGKSFVLTYHSLKMLKWTIWEDITQVSESILGNPQAIIVAE